MKTDILEQAVGLLQVEAYTAAVALLEVATTEYPTDAQFRLLRGIALKAQGHKHKGWEALWHALASAPEYKGTRAALADTVLLTDSAPPPDRDFSLNSGERQTAANVDAIRADHRYRYEAAAQWLRRHTPQPWRLTGLDVFCGNGYGSRIIADTTGARMVGLDGSAEAVELAERHYGNHRVIFGNACFPFTLEEDLFDFAVCFESVEHVDDAEGVLRQLSRAVRGPLFISVPLDGGLPFDSNRERFSHHVRHYLSQDLHALLRQIGRPVIAAEWGQVTYHMNDQKVDAPLPPGEMHLGPVHPNTQFLTVVALPTAE